MNMLLTIENSWGKIMEEVRGMEVTTIMVGSYKHVILDPHNY